MNSTPECVTKTPEIEAREKLAAIFSDAEQRGDNSKVNPELGKTAFDIEDTSKMDSADNEAVDFCKQVLGENEKPTDPVESVKEIGNMLADLRKTKANEVQ
ncbi:hypothetical protein EUA70_02000 [TM7 phylum sp. oral taxon 352]|nr:hypothetical protein EUA74_01375 [TM7 phylum sp. oral taxon 352]TWP17950.1 hypothetical protein EUA70_02000 [TM7 phylum sp. oral taxon 352]TWP18241.1 hypothetical protein EUA71_02540 [TM7 phylum sp. oral taxon 352]